MFAKIIQRVSCVMHFDNSIAALTIIRTYDDLIETYLVHKLVSYGCNEILKEKWKNYFVPTHSYFFNSNDTMYRYTLKEKILTR